MFRVAKVTVCKTDGEIPRRFESYHGHMKLSTNYKMADMATDKYFRKKYNYTLSHPKYIDIWNYLVDNNVINAEVICSKISITKFIVNGVVVKTMEIPDTIFDTDGDIDFPKLVRLMLMFVVDNKLC